MYSTSHFKELLQKTLSTNGNPNLSGNRVAITIMETNWKENKYDQNIVIWDSITQTRTQLTRSGSVSAVSWLNETDLIVLQQDTDKKNQLFLYQNLTGDPIQLTTEESGVQSFVTAGTDAIIYQVDDPKKFELKQRKDKFGEFTHVEEEKPASKLQFFIVNQLIAYRTKLQYLNEEESKKEILPILDLTSQISDPLYIRNYFSSVDGQQLIINGNRKSDLIFAQSWEIFHLDFNGQVEMSNYLQQKQEHAKDESMNKDDEISPLVIGKLTKVLLPENASIVSFSPSGDELLISHQDRDNFYYTQSDLWICSTDKVLQGSKVTRSDFKKLTGSIDQSLFGGVWTDRGIYFMNFDHTKAQLSRVDPITTEVTAISLPEGFHGGFFVSNQQGDIVCNAYHKEKISELFFISLEGTAIQISDDSSEFEDLPKSTMETVSWTSIDGSLIEGIMRKPDNFDPSRKYPLVFIVHGGPSWVSFETIFANQDRAYYPSIQFANEDIITIYPNYRGSIGRGQNFLELNVNNLGIGDLWDIESAIDYFVEEGFVDADKIGCMGWSQGGYISAMATTHASDRFIATSVGAGISDWYSYWMTTDIRKFTVDYLSDSPINNREIYRKTSPMSAIDKASTPTLIQIGENDRRVPMVNATELYRALVDKNVSTQLFVFSGMPHGINKPRENLAVISQNYQWFIHYLKDIEFSEFDDPFFSE